MMTLFNYISLVNYRFNVYYNYYICFNKLIDALKKKLKLPGGSKCLYE